MDDATVVGIDLSGLSRGTKGRTAAARLRIDDPPEVIDLRVFAPKVASDRDLLTWVTDPRPEVVAIDAPLTLPHGVLCAEVGCARCQPGRGEYLSRDIDRPAKGMPTVMLAAIMFRGMYIARLLRERDITVIETYPRAAYRAWSVAGTSVLTAEEALGSRVIGFGGGTADERDAVAAAVAAAAYATGTAIGITGADGVMWLPGA